MEQEVVEAEFKERSRATEEALERLNQRHGEDQSNLRERLAGLQKEGMDFKEQLPQICSLGAGESLELLDNTVGKVTQRLLAFKDLGQSQEMLQDEGTRRRR